MTGNFLIVGGSQGIGLALTQRLLDAGAQVAVASRHRGQLPEHPNLQHLSFDALGEEKPEIPFEELQGLAYCPGSINLKPFKSLKDQDFEQDFQLNVVGAVRVLRAAFPKLKKAGQASVVLFSTVAVQQGMPYHSTVASAKGAIEGLTRSLAAEWAPAVRVNAVAPSVVDTPLAQRLLSSEERREGSAKRHPLQRVGEAEDIAAAAAYLLSPDSAWVTGQILGVDGGMSATKGL